MKSDGCKGRGHLAAHVEDTLGDGDAYFAPPAERASAIAGMRLACDFLHDLAESLAIHGDCSHTSVRAVRHLAIEMGWSSRRAGDSQ